MGNKKDTEQFAPESASDNIVDNINITQDSVNCQAVKGKDKSKCKSKGNSKGKVLSIHAKVYSVAI